MIVPEGYISLHDAGRELAGNYIYPDNDFDDAGWCDELWRVVDRLKIRGVAPDGGLLKIPRDDRRETSSHGWFGPLEDYTPFENEWLDLSDGRIISGQFKGCMVVISEREWAAYLREREGKPVNKGGRPKHPAYEWYKARGFDRGGKYLATIQREMPKDDRGRLPSQATIRAWEKEGQQKPPTET